MKTLKLNYGFYISVGLLGVAIAGSGFLYKKEADKAKRLDAEATKVREHVTGVRMSIPTQEHKEFLGKQKEEIEENYTEIVQEALRWSYVPEELDALRFLGYMKSTLRHIKEAARNSQIVIDAKAENLGFDEYAAAPPGPGEDVLQLQREFSAATDVAFLLIASNVYSIDRMVRGEAARMLEGQSAPGVLGAEAASTPRRTSKFDFYDTVAFRVRFTCTYPSLAFFQKSLITPQKISIGNERYPKNFLVVNDLSFKVKETEGEASDRAMAAMDRVRTSAYSLAYSLARGGRGPQAVELPEDLPDAYLILERNREQAIQFFSMWRTWPPEQKEIWRIDNQLLQQIAEADKERLRARRDRLLKELEYRKLEGRPPEYSLIEVELMIDFVQFNEKLIAELEPKGAKRDRSTPSSPSTGRR